MESLPPTHQEGPVSPSLPHVFSSIKIEPTSMWNPPNIPPVSSNLSENTPTYTPLEPVYPEESYAPSSTQYFHASSSSALTQPIYSSCNMSQEYQPLLHSALYRDVDLNQTARDEGLGSSPSSFSSSTPPLPHQQTNVNGHIVGPSRPSSNLDYSQRSTSSTPESIVFSSYSPECSNCGNRNDIYWYSTHYLCRQCLPERPVVQVQQASPVLEDSSKRKRSVQAANKNLNQVCTNCEATHSKLWRRSISTGNTVCNACGLYEKLHHVPRPKHMRKDTIQSRKRKPKASRSNPKVKSSSRKNAKKSTSETNLSPQYIPANDVQNYPLPTYNTHYSSSNNSHMLPPLNNQTFYANFRPEMYIYNSVAPNEIINITQGLPSNISYASS